MFTTVYSGPRVKQHLSFVLSLSLQAALVALLCLMPAPHACQHALAHPDLHSALMMPLSFLEPPPATPDKGSFHTSNPPKPPSASGSTLTAPAASPAEAKVTQPKADVPALKPSEITKPVEAEAKAVEAESKPAEAAPEAQVSATAAENSNASDGLVPFPSWQMHSDTSGHGFMHHQINAAMPVFTPEPPILHGQYPDAARGKDVVLNVVINEQGTIVAVEVLQGIGNGVEQAIVDTLRQWIYVPAKVNGVAIISQQQVRFHFPG